MNTVRWIGRDIKYEIAVATLVVFCFSLLSFKTSIRPIDVYGWETVEWGMSSEEVRNVLRKKVKERNIRVDETDNMYSGLQLRGVNIGGSGFRASLWMHNNTDELARIVFVPEKQPSQYEWAEDFIQLENYLVKKYGNPDVQKTSNDPGTSADRIWKFPSTNIELSYLKLEDSELLLLVFSKSENS